MHCSCWMFSLRSIPPDTVQSVGQVNRRSTLLPVVNTVDASRKRRPRHKLARSISLTTGAASASCASLFVPAVDRPAPSSTARCVTLLPQPEPAAAAAGDGWQHWAKDDVMMAGRLVVVSSCCSNAWSTAVRQAGCSNSQGVQNANRFPKGIATLEMDEEWLDHIVKDYK
jgi:hypothetical protein